MEGGTSNPAFIDDNATPVQNNTDNQITVIHTNPERVIASDNNHAQAEVNYLHESKSVPVLSNYESTTELIPVGKTESLEEINPIEMNNIQAAPSTTLTNGDYGSRIILVEDKLASIPIEDTPPYSEVNEYDNNKKTNDNNYAVTNYEANITLSQEKPKSQEDSSKEKQKEIEEEDESSTGRDTWGKEIEFLLSCIAMSVGLGNVWRFPFIALENGGGAFVIPYIIVLIVVGKPIYYLEMLIGQFSSRGSAKVYDLCPALRGTGMGQIVAVLCLTTFYTGLMAIILNYLVESFSNPLPWAYCKKEWTNCIDAASKNIGDTQVINLTNYKTSAEFHYLQEVLKEKDSIDDGIGIPNYKLVIYLFISWSLVAGLLIKGVKSSGKASYFLALFPYVVLGILFIRAVTLEGSMLGLKYFFAPQWDKLTDPEVWYNAVTQVFFSLSVCFGNVIMYASYNKFRHNVSRDATIITSIDTLTSLLAGSTVFGILGHLAHKVGTEDVGIVVKGGPGLAFISYPDAIAKFDWFPQGFAVLFFFMLYVLGIGSNVAMVSCIVTIVKDKFPHLKQWILVTSISTVMFGIAIVYTTPGGQFILELVDHHGATFVVFFLAIVELAALCWVYGVNRICNDVYFMLGYRPNIIWRACWFVITPAVMIIIFIYSLIHLKPVTYNGYVYKPEVYAIGWCITALGLGQLPLWMAVSYIKRPHDNCVKRFINMFRPLPNWGPTNPALLRKYKEFISTID